MTEPIRGVLPIANTPFRDDDSIDFESLRRQIDWAFATGADGYATGMVSELLWLTFDERQELTEKLAEFANDREGRRGHSTFRSITQCAPTRHSSARHNRRLARCEK